MSILCTTREPQIRLADAVVAWSSLLGNEYVRDDATTRDRYSRACIPNSTRPAAVVYPGSAAEVIAVVRIAAEYRIPLYPVSRGRNWGYGSACAVTDSQVIVDLGRLNRILELNRELAYAVIEPGVTQGQLYEHLRTQGDELMLDVTGAGPDASIVGNALERGFGHSPYGDHFQHTCGMEVVLADGRLLRTGFGCYQNAQAARVYPWGIGPWIDGLFSQSNFGIVTKLGISLMPRPPVCQAFGFTIPDPDQLGQIVTCLRTLRLHNIVNSSVHIANDLRVLSSRMQYPWRLANGVTPLPDGVRVALRKSAALGAWNVLGGLYGTKETVAAAQKAVQNAFRGLVRVRFFDRSRIERLQKLGSVLGRFGLGNNLRETLASASSVYDLLQGIPSPNHLKGLHWRSQRCTSSDDPADFGCLWLSPVLPMTADACRDVLAIVPSILSRHRFDPLFTMTTVNPRALCCVINIIYDKGIDDERLEAANCYDELFHALFQRGYVPYRVGIQSMPKLAMRSDVYWDVCRQLKSALDPEGIIAPGRYEPNDA